MRPYFSIIIPAKNRANTIVETLKTIFSQPFNDYEVILSDDFSDDQTKNLVKEFEKKPNFIFTNPKESGMMNNFEHAISMSCGQYLIVLGGDDGLLPNSLSELQNLIRKKNSKLITWPTPAFFYPGLRSEYSFLTLPIESFLRKNITKIKSSEFLDNQFKNLFYIADKFNPMIYVKSVISANFVKEIKEKNDGKLFHCSTPDGFSGLLFASNIDNFLYSSKPFTFHGVSKNSAGFTYMKGDKKSRKVSEEFFKNISKITMHKKLANAPYSPLITLMTADFLLTCMDRNTWKYKKRDLNYKKIIKNSLLELSDGIFSKSNIARELKIIKKIAAHHGLINYFLVLLKQIKRNSRKDFNLNAMSFERFYISGNLFNADNHYEASIEIDRILKQGLPFPISCWPELIKNSLNYKMLSYKKKEPLINFFEDNAN